MRFLNYILLFVVSLMLSACLLTDEEIVFLNNSLYYVMGEQGTFYSPDVVVDEAGEEISSFPLMSINGIQIRGADINDDATLDHLVMIADKYCKQIYKDTKYQFVTNSDQIDRYNPDSSIVIIFGECTKS